ncbi:MAG TPA: VWA domain-containing protein [Bryobacteraceae bacterium]|nr:VWA domain-containing protein [Bryobacteraceae bacterium]
MTSLTGKSRMLFAAGLIVAGVVLPAHASSITDVEFVMASDGAVTASGWASEQNFVTNAVDNILPFNDSRVGVVEFSSTSLVELSSRELTTASQPTIDSLVSGLTFWDQNTYVSDGVQDGIDELVNAGPASDNKLMVLLTNGIPNPGNAQNPCDTSGQYPEAANIRHELAVNSISVLEVMVGPNPSTQTLGCLVNYDSSRVVPVASAGTTLSALFTTEDAGASVPEPGGFGLAAGALGVLGLALSRGWRRAGIRRQG